MIYIVCWSRVGGANETCGHGAVPAAANDAFTVKSGATGLILKPAQSLLRHAGAARRCCLHVSAYADRHLCLVVGGHDPQERDPVAGLHPLLGLIALLGYMAYGRDRVSSPNDAACAVQGLFVPFIGFAFSAIAIGALVPAAVMSIGAANLFTRNVWKSYVNPDISHAGEAAVAKIASLVVKVGALAFILFLPTQYALDLQLLGGLWILQTFPALVFGLFTRWFRAEGLLLGWVAGIGWGSWTAWSNGLKPLATIDLGGASYAFYVGLGALILNIVVAAVVTVIVGLISPSRAGVTARS